MSNRSERKQIAANTLDIIKNGLYSFPTGNGMDAEVISIKEDITKCDENTKIYDRNDWEKLFTKFTSPLQWQGRTTKFEVTDEYSLTCCKRLHEEGYENITCLNFASAKHPCGGMINGSIAQEESLGLCSALHSSLSKQEVHYGANIKDPKNGLYQDSLIYSPGCPVFRNDTNYKLLERPFNVNFISCPAVNLSVSRAPLNVVKETMLRRTNAILSVAADEGCDVLVLGAWGTGVFQNAIKDVASYFKEYLIPKSDDLLSDQNMGSFVNIFPNQCLPTVVFAVGQETHKQQAFKAAFLDS